MMKMILGLIFFSSGVVLLNQTLAKDTPAKEMKKIRETELSPWIREKDRRLRIFLGIAGIVTSLYLFFS
jgi:hypothetical protein